MIFSEVYDSTESVWHQRDTLEFNELILSWNGERPKVGKWTFSVAVKENEWLKVAEWGPTFQRSFESIGEFAKNYQDTLDCQRLCTEFWVKVEGDELEGLKRISACVSNTANHRVGAPIELAPIELKNVPRQSQMVLDHERKRDLCSPTSTSTAIRFLTKKDLDVIEFANAVHDSGFNIFGNWSFSVAECYNRLKEPCVVERLKDFNALHAHLMMGKPVVVSVKGEIARAPMAYNQGHLMCVVGYSEGEVICIDSAFAENELCYVKYKLEDFLAAWGKRKNLAYTFR